MQAKYLITAQFEGNDEEFYKELAEEQEDLGTWHVEEQNAVCILKATTAESVDAMLISFGDERHEEEVEQVAQLEVGKEIELERGRGCVYTFKRIK